MATLPWKCDQCKASFYKANLLQMHQAAFHGGSTQPVNVETKTNTPPQRVIEKASATRTPPRQQSEESEDSDSDRIRLEQKFNHLKVVQRIHKVDSFSEDIRVNLLPNDKYNVKVEFEEPNSEEAGPEETTEELLSQEMWEKLQEQDGVCFLVVKEDGIYVTDQPPFENEENNAEDIMMHENADEIMDNVDANESKSNQTGIEYREEENEGADSDTVICYRPDPTTMEPYKNPSPYVTNVMTRPVHSGTGSTISKRQAIMPKKFGVLEFKCKRCELVFPTRHERRLHLETHAHDLRHFCSVCGRGFRKTHSLKLHLNVHTEGSHHQCPYCHQFYRAERYLKEHIKLHMPEEYKFQCEVCSKKFAHRVSWRYHMSSHTNDTPFVCYLCGKAYRQRVSLEAHLNLHEGARPHKCAECGKGFRTVTTLRDHRRLHTNERPFVCRHPGCDKKYILKNQLKNHMKKHTGIRNFACSVGSCEKRFFFRSHLVRHLTRTHKLRAVDGQSFGIEQGDVYELVKPEVSDSESE